MIFGKNNATKYEIEQTKIRSKINGVKKWALFPVRLKDGYWVWLEHYYAYYHGRVDVKGRYFLWFGSSESDSPIVDYYLNQSDSYQVLSEPKQ